MARSPALISPDTQAFKTMADDHVFSEQAKSDSIDSPRESPKLSEIATYIEIAIALAAVFGLLAGVGVGVGMGMVFGKP